MKALAASLAEPDGTGDCPGGRSGTAGAGAGDGPGATAGVPQRTRPLQQQRERRDQMQNVAPAHDQVRAGRRLQLAFLSAVVSLAAAFAAVGSTIPLFNIYRAEDGFTNADISMTVVAYSVGTIGTLLTLGRLSSHV